MAIIKPAQFPQLQSTQVQNNKKPVPVKKAIPVVQKPVEQKSVRASATLVKTNTGINMTKEEKLEVAIEVLRQKTAQFYGPKKAEVKKAAALGSFIDIKA